MSRKLLKSNIWSPETERVNHSHFSLGNSSIKRAWNRATFSSPQIPCALIFANWHFVNPMLIVSILAYGPICSSRLRDTLVTTISKRRLDSKLLATYILFKDIFVPHIQTTFSQSFPDV